ncbi:MAG: hypothetical protein ACK4MS_16305, partial [Paracoccaceae bacterium]
LDGEDRVKFSDFVVQTFEAQNIFVFEYANIGGGTVFDGVVEPKDVSTRRWEERVPAFAMDVTDAHQRFYELYVPTVDSTRLGAVAALCLRARRPVLLTGVTGCGKTTTLRTMVQDLSLPPAAAALVEAGEAVPPHVVPLCLASHSSSATLQRALEAKLERHHAGYLAAPAGRVAVLLVDDINTPTPEPFGAQPPLELLRQAVEAGGVFDRQAWSWLALQDTLVVAA